MIHIQNIYKHFGQKVIFNGTSAHVPPGARVGLVGPNGSGKTTLLRMLVNEEEVDSGNIVIRKGASIRYLKQEVWDNPERSIIAEVLAGFPEIQKLEQALIEMEAQMLQESSREMIECYGELRHKLEACGGYEIEHQAKAVLTGMGFRPEHFTRPLHEFSGGWMMRVSFAKLLVLHPDVLLLDEPTNHLDLESVVWLEGFLMNYPGTIILTSHDQVFMERIADHILEISKCKLNMFVEDFEGYVEKKALIQEQLEAQYRNQQKKIEQTERFIERFRYKATKAKQVQSRIRMLKKMEKVDTPEESNRVMKMRLPQPPRSGLEVVKLSKVTKRYGSLTVYQELDFHILRGEKVVLVGPNGAGKSTLLKIIAGVVDIQGGEVQYGHNVTMDYYAQHQLETLNHSLSIMEEFGGVMPGATITECRTFLGAFLFTGEDVYKPISVLSGGEKARVALAKMLSQPANLLVMDEPTNHLDILSRQVLEDALADFQGTLIFISHDRAFINSITNRVVEIKAGQLNSYPGNYDDYIWKKAQEEASAEGETSREEGVSVQCVSSVNISKKQERRMRAERIQEMSRLLKPLKKRLSNIEQSIQLLEKESEEITAELCSLSVMTDKSLYPAKLKHHRELESRLRECYDEWARVAEHIEEINNEYNQG